jgi:hypothetical protein
MADVLDCLHAEVRGVEVRRVQLLQVQYWAHSTALFRYEKDGTDVTERWRKEWNFLFGFLEEEGFYLLIDVAIVLALRGGAEMRAQQGKRQGEVK